MLPTATFNNGNFIDKTVKRLVLNIDDILNDQDNPSAEMEVIQRLLAVNKVLFDKVCKSFLCCLSY